jgi:glycosyltransferase involved in cell wall biosynthesis
MKASVVVPNYNSENVMADLLEALESQTFRDFELVIVDDGSTDNCLKVIEDHKKSSGMKVTVLRQDHAGPAKARNLGVENAKSDIVVFVDSDCVPEKDWLSEMIKPFRDKEIAAVQGTYKTHNKDRLIARYVGYEIDYRHEKMKSREGVDWLGTFSAACRKEAFFRVGGFDTVFRTANAEDPELAFKIRKMGYRIVFNPKAVVAHRHPPTLTSFLRQQFKRGYWRIPMYKKHRDKIAGDSYTGRGLVVQGLLVTALFLTVLTLNTLIVSAVFVLLIASNIPFGIFSFRKEKKFVLLAPVIASLRSITGFVGMCFGFLKFIKDN